MTKLYRWEDEKFFSAKNSYDDFDRLNMPWDHGHEAVGPNCLYACGKIAWMPEMRLIILDDLANRSRMIYSVPLIVPMGTDTDLSALGDKLLVVISDRTLLAWEYTSGRFSSVTLPGEVTRCSTEGLRVAVVTQAENDSKELIVWYFQGDLQRLEYASLLNDVTKEDKDAKDHFVNNLDIILHTHQDDVAFVVTAYPDIRSVKPGQPGHTNLRGKEIMRATTVFLYGTRAR
ncbi:Uu.00g134590.m01.CDS01 [Anthostomella pinea]|uniref:Uu.00g134590.m01.CDS01 n=1 Tax=Anthostomella pinea TaxID=933095 RepID=A0AAI8YKU9_9PEZI|nr:Uu.00g134590.m01.CDS01 [Anthostomella pinea]